MKGLALERAMAAATAVALLASAAPTAAQPLTERSPNLEGTWVTSPRNLHFQFAHRFQVAGEDNITDIFAGGKIINYPTFALGYGVTRGVMVGFRYSTNARLVASKVNEWQPYLKWSPLYRSGVSTWSVSLTGAFNEAAESLDGELAAQIELFDNRVFVIPAVRGFTSAFDEAILVDPNEAGDAALAIAGGLGIRVNNYITLAGDVADLVSGPDATAGWSAGLHIGIPFTPHTFSIMATNVMSGTLQGTSTGVDDTVFWGFEFTVPFSGFARWGRILRPNESGGQEAAVGREAAPDAARARADEGDGARSGKAVEIDIKRFRFGDGRLEIPAGTIVRWVNRDPVAHTATADGGAWDSPLIGPGETYQFTFEAPGEYSYHCRPHPFMKGTIVVSES